MVVTRWDERIGLEGLKPGRRTRRKQTGAVAKPNRRQSELLITLCANTHGPLGRAGEEGSGLELQSELSFSFCQLLHTLIECCIAAPLHPSHRIDIPAHSLRLGLRIAQASRTRSPSSKLLRQQHSPRPLASRITHNALATALDSLVAAFRRSSREEVLRRPVQRLPRQIRLRPAQARRCHVHAIDQGTPGLLGSSIAHCFGDTFWMRALPTIPA